jgi:serine/threonine-protein kinase
MSTLTKAEKRAAQLAVSRYGADLARVQQICKAVLQAQAQGRVVDLLETLVAQKVLTVAQARDLRLALSDTHLDARASERDGDPTPVPGGRATVPPAFDTDDVHDADHVLENGEFVLKALGKYRIMRKLGSGGMGAVYLGYDESEDRQIAIKVLSSELCGNQASVDRFYREAKSGALLNHPNIVRNLAVGQDSATGRHYLVLEYVDGPSAHALLDQFGKLSVGDAVHIILDIARGLEHAHSRSIVHRDIKPDNILITRSGVAKISDLGLAKRMDEASHLTSARQGFGTPYYMPYEQAMNAKYADGRSDIYALGATLYHLVVGEVPFNGDNPIEIVEKKNEGYFPPASSLNPAVPPLLDDILERMLAREPADRYQTVSELIVELERANLSAKVPSFVDPELALQDPVMRNRLTAPAQPTAPDMRMPARDFLAEQRKSNPDVWYLRYRDGKGKWTKAKLTTQQIRQRLAEGRLSPEVEAAHLPQDEFLPLRKYGDFQAVALESVKRSRRRPMSDEDTDESPSAQRAELETVSPTASRTWWLIGAAIAATLVTAAVVVYRVWLGP